MQRTDLVLVTIMAISVSLVQTGRAESKRIENNSFLIEEVYNHEPGVVQHVQTFQRMKDKSWPYTFFLKIKAAVNLQYGLTAISGV